MFKFCKELDKKTIELENGIEEIFSLSLPIEKDSKILKITEQNLNSDFYVTVNFYDENVIHYYIDIIEENHPVYRREFFLNNNMLKQIDILVMQVLTCLKCDKICISDQIHIY